VSYSECMISSWLGFHSTWVGFGEYCLFRLFMVSKPKPHVATEGM
jgi:hypothetical protein